MNSLRLLLLWIALPGMIAGCVAPVVSGPRAWLDEDIVDHTLSLLSDTHYGSYTFKANGDVYAALGTRMQPRMTVLRWEITRSGALVLEDLSGRVFAEYKIVEIKGNRYVLDDGTDWLTFRRT